MATIDRYSGNVQAFAQNATGTNRTVFNSVTESDALTDNANTDFLLGWEIVSPNDSPTKQDFNALGFTLGQFLAYLHQVGIPEYHVAQEFKTNSFVNYGGVLYKSLVDANIGNQPDISPVEWEDFLANAITQDSSTGAAQLPVGTTAQQGTPDAGKVRYNSELGRYEGGNGTGFVGLGGATGAGGDAVFYENDQTVDSDYTITTGKNAMSAGDITIADGVTVTVPDGSTWSIV